MKKELYILIFIVISFVITTFIFVPQVMGLKQKSDSNISLMYTDKNHIATYGIYDTTKNEFKNVYSRKNENFSDFAIDKKSNVLYYSDLVDKKYNIYKVNLTNKENNTESLLNNNYNGDIFDLYNNILIFRTIQNNNKNYTLGIFDLETKKIKVFNNNDMDLYIYNFYYNKFNNKIYTIERSLSEMNSKKFSDIPTHKVAEYDEIGKNKKQIYSTNKFINNICVNKEANKLVFDATDVVNNNTINSIYLVDLKNNNEKVILRPGDKFEDTKFTLIKNPQFSSDEKGIFFLGSTLTSNSIEKVDASNPITSNALYYYEFSTSKISKIFEVGDAIINRFKLN